jgi:hypothetical protein
MTGHARSTAREVHELLVEARPEANNVNLVKAAHLAEAAGTPGDRFQMETFVAIRNIETAIESGSGAAELKSLLKHAVKVAEHWATAA